MTTTAPAPPPAGTSAPVLSRPWAAGTGLLGVGAALAAGDLVAGLIDPPTSPFLAVGNQFIRITPEWLKQFAISAFGTYDKVALLGGMAVVIALVSAAAGLASRRTPTVGLVVIATMGVLAAAAATLSPTYGPGDLLPPLASLVAGLGVFALVHRALLAWAGPSAGRHADGAPGLVERRRALTLAGGALAGTVVAGLGGRLLAGSSGAEASREAVGPLPAAPAPPRIPAGADFAPNGTPTFLTANADFYRIDTALQVPQVPTATWSLRIHGMVDREVTVTFDQLRARRLIEKPITMTCVSNPVGGDLMSTAIFLGVPVADLLAEAGVRPGAQQVFSTSVDGFTIGTPLGPLTDPGRDAMLAIGMNGEPLPVEHGFPVRMVVPGLYGYVSACKWITDMEVTTWDTRTSYWELRGWAQEAPIRTQSRIDVPRAEASVPAGRVVVAGTAWAQHVGVAGVQVRADGGRWQQAELSTEVGLDTWRMWRATVDLAPGRHQLQVRAGDRSGYVQTPQLRDTIPDGATGWHTIAVTAT